MGTTADYGTAASPRSGATSLSAWAAAVHARLEALRTELGLGTASGRNVPAAGNAGATEVVLGADTRLSDARTPVAHAASHGSAGADAVTIAESQVTGLVTDLAAKAPTARTITAGAGLTGGGSLAADRTLDVGAGAGISVGADAVSVDTTWGDARWRTMVRATFSNADAVCAAATRYLGQVGTMSAARTVTLPAASAVPAGAEIVVADDSGTVTATNTITIARAGSDLINGATTMTIAQAYGSRRLCSDGISRWSVDGGVLRSSSNLSDVASTSTALANLGGVPAATMGNLLTANQASIETDTTGWALDGALSLERTTADAYHGSASLLITAAANVGWGIRLAGNYKTALPIRPQQVYTAQVELKAQTGSRPWRTLINWWDSGGVLVGTVYGTPVTPVAGGWVLATMTAVAPPTAAFLDFRVMPAAAGVAGDSAVFADCFGVWAGAGGDWGMPGTPIVNQGTWVTHPSVDDVLVQVWDSANSRKQATWYDSGVRDVSDLLSSGWTASAVRLRRINTAVELVLTGLNGASATSGTILTLPAGFRPSVALPTPIGDTASTVPNRLITANTNGTVVAGTGYANITAGSVRLEHNTTAARDTSLPGTLISAAPYA